MNQRAFLLLALCATLISAQAPPPLPTNRPADVPSVAVTDKPAPSAQSPSDAATTTPPPPPPVLNAANLTNPLNATNVTAANGTLNATNTTAASNTTGNLTATLQPKGNCLHFCRRREIRNLSVSERNSYFAAIKKLMEGPSPTKYDQLVKLHIDATDYAHNTPYFLTWHRGYLYEFEKALQAVDPTICLPYWNWSVDSQAPENSVVFAQDYYGGNGGGNGGCVQDGYFAGWQPYYPQPHCLQRRYKYRDNLGAFNSYEGMNRIVTKHSTYSTFSKACETLAHPTPHVNIGGDMKEMHSPNDPIFWGHHAYIDYTWSQWQKMRSFSEVSGVSKSDKHLGLSTTVAQVLDHRTLCYDYVEMSDTDLGDQPLPPPTVAKPEKSGQKPDRVKVVTLPSEEERYSSSDRSNLNIVRYPDYADEEWLTRNKYDVNEVRGYEKEQRALYKEVNEIKGYVSPCALWKRPALCSVLIKQQKQLYVDVKDYGRIVVEYDSQVDVYQAYSNVKQRVNYCTPDVEYPEEQYRKSVEKLVGNAAFKGAGTLKTVTSEDDLSSADLKTAVHNAALCVALAMPIFVAY